MLKNLQKNIDIMSKEMKHFRKAIENVKKKQM